MEIKNTWLYSAWQASLKALLGFKIDNQTKTVGSILEDKDLCLELDEDEHGCHYYFENELFNSVNALLNSDPFIEMFSGGRKKGNKSALLAELADIFLFPDGCPECGSGSLQRERFIPTCYITSVNGKNRVGSDLQDGLPEDVTVEERYYCPDCEMYFAERQRDATGYLLKDSTGIFEPEGKTSVVWFDNKKAEVISVETFDDVDEAIRAAALEAGFYEHDAPPEDEIEFSLASTGHWRRYDDSGLDWYVKPVRPSISRIRERI